MRSEEVTLDNGSTSAACASTSHPFVISCTAYQIVVPIILIQEQLSFLVTILVLASNIQYKKAKASNVWTLLIVHGLFDLFTVNINTDCKYWLPLRNETVQFSSRKLLRKRIPHTFIFIIVCFYGQWCSRDFLHLLNPDIFQDWLGVSVRYGLFQRLGRRSGFFSWWRLFFGDWDNYFNSLFHKYLCTQT